MAYDEGLAHRIEEQLMGLPDPWEGKRMFGGLCFMVRGHMAFGMVGEELMVRVPRDEWAELVTRPHVREMDFTGKSLKGMVYVAAEGIDDDDDLTAWMERGVELARSLPPKKPKKPKAPRAARIPRRPRD